VKVTRITYSRDLTTSKYERLEEIARLLGVLRSEVWNEYGSLKGVGVRDRHIRDEWLQSGKDFGPLPARLWKETLRDVVADIKAYREAAKEKVKRAIRDRTENDGERKRLYTLLKRDEWLEDSFLRRQMRKHFKHGHTSVRNQIVLDPCSYKAFVFSGKAWIDVMSLVPRGRIAIQLNTTREPSGTLRLILRDGIVAVHYAVDEQSACSVRPCGTATIGVDKGYTEALTDSDDEQHGKRLGALLSAESDYLKTKYQRRSKLHAVARAKPHKAQVIYENNLGRKKLNERRRKHTANVKDVIHKAVHAVVDKASTVVAEDLSWSTSSSKRLSKNTKRRLSGWVKGILALALTNVSRRRGATLRMVSAAYTSQTDSRYGILLGERRGDLFHCFDGEVLQADYNAARNVLARLHDPEIGRFTPYREIKRILQKRTEHWLSSPEGKLRLGLLNQDSSCVPF